MLILNRIRGMFSWFAWIVGALLAVIVYVKFGNAYVALLVMAGYIGGESMGWGEWIGGISTPGQTLDDDDIEGKKYGIYWLASHVAMRGTLLYNYVALAIRGVYWWLPTLLPLAWFIDIGTILISVVCLAMAFPMSVVVAKECRFVLPYVTTTWKRAEVIYGGVMNIVLLCLFLGVSI